MVQFLGGAQNAVILPYARADGQYDLSLARLITKLGESGIKARGLHTFRQPAKAIASADAILVNGGNSFCLVKAIHELGLIRPVRAAVARGVPYWGASAGSNVAGLSIRTTNDMPIVQPATFRSFGLVPFQINPHFVDAPPAEQAVRETREVRLREFLSVNDVTVLGLREESWLIVKGNTAQLRGTAGAALFQRDLPQRELKSGTEVSFLLLERSRFDVKPKAQSATMGLG